MPTYTIRDNTSGEVKEIFLTMSEKETLLKENQHLEQLIVTAPRIGDPVRLGIRRIDNGFRDVLKEVKHHHPKGTLDV